MIDRKILFSKFLKSFSALVLSYLQVECNVAKIQVALTENCQIHVYRLIIGFCIQNIVIIN